MVRIIGTVRDSGNQPQSGVLEVFADGRIYDYISGAIVVQTPARFVVPDGDFSRMYREGAAVAPVDFISSLEVSYRFRFLSTAIVYTYYDSEDRVWQGDVHEYQGATFTGLTHGTESQLLRVDKRTTESDLIPSFHAILPFAETVSFFDLLPTGVTESNQDASILAVATAIATRPSLRQAIVDAVLAAMP
jgi:hypothetical protein